MKKMTVPYNLVKMMLTGDRVEYLPEAGKNIDISNSLKIYLTMLCMLGEAKPSFFREKKCRMQI